MSNYSETITILWYTLVVLAFVVQPMLLICAKRVSNYAWARMAVYQGIVAYFGYTLT